MKSKYGVTAKLVWDGTDEVRIPSELGTPALNQMKGTFSERLSELAGRACYDSLGRGRSSEDYHKHILEVGHGSVYEHANICIMIEGLETHFGIFLNRPGIWVRSPARNKVVLTVNPRSLIDWHRWHGCKTPESGVYDAAVAEILAYYGEQLWPQIMPPTSRLAPRLDFINQHACVIPPADEEEKWITMFMAGSRGFSHELVRHGDRTGISQRCLAGDTIITMVNGKGHAMPVRKKNGPRTIRWLYERMQDPRLRKVVGKLKPRVLDEKAGLFTTGKLADVISSGRKPCFDVELDDGYKIKCTEDHRIWTETGWKTLKEIASPEVANSGVVTWKRDEACLVGVNGIMAVGNGLYRDAAWMKARVNDDLSDQQIAAQCGATPGTVKAYRIRMGLLKRIMRDFSDSPVRNKQWLKRNYRERGLSQGEIAKLAGCSVAVVHNWARKHGIQKKRYEINLGRIPWNKGTSYSKTKPYSQETIERYRASKLGAKNPRWKGGVSGSEARRAFHAWKKKNGVSIFRRDGFRCRVCHRPGSQVPFNGRHMKKRTIEIHHILPLWNRPDLSCEPGNMATVCWQCQAQKLNGHEMDYAQKLLTSIQSPVPYVLSERKRPHGVRKVQVHYKAIKAIRYAGVIDTYDLVLEGPNHGFVGNGVVVHNSTRFVNEDESEWINHPLVQEYLIAEDVAAHQKKTLANQVENTINIAKKTYSDVNEALYAWLLKKGVDKGTARKQARGAARGYLGNALSTEIIFSASVAQWKRMMRMRCCGPADAEIRAVFVEALLEFRNSRYADSFQQFELVPSSDGMGSCAVEKT